MGKKVTHIITGLGKGGAETMLYQVLKFRTDSSIEYSVISLGGSSYYEDMIRELGVPVEICPIKKTPFSSVFRIINNVKGSDVLCCWMMHANLIGFLVSKLTGVKCVIWCVRHSNTGRKFMKARTVWVDSICARLSKKVDLIAYNGNRSREAYEDLGFCKEKGVVLDNGCDCEEYTPNPEARSLIMNELGISSNKKIVLSVSKNVPIKDIPAFIRAYGLIQKKSDTVAIVCGSGVVENDQMLELCREVGLEPHKDIYFLGLRHDVPKIMAACDLYVLHSAGEAFPNTLLQAMAVSCLCIATNVGDARRILGDDRFIVSPQNVSKLADKMYEAIMLPTEECDAIKAENRRQVKKYFDIREIVKKYEEIYL